ncbi:hypothetical protein KM043_011992 [Ampulex compressa]|nr:hypothetical protein KM043_011992 [Ampulex compressa]
MSEGCTSCRGANYAGSTLQLGSASGGGTGSGPAAPGTSCTATKRVQVRAKVLYGIILAFLSCALSRAREEHDPRGAIARLRSSSKDPPNDRKVSLGSSILGRGEAYVEENSDSSRNGRREGVEIVEDSVAEDRNESDPSKEEDRYEEIVQYVRRILEEEVEEANAGGYSAKEGNEAREEGVDVEALRAADEGVDGAVEARKRHEDPGIASKNSRDEESRNLAGKETFSKKGSEILRGEWKSMERREDGKAKKELGINDNRSADGRTDEKLWETEEEDLLEAANFGLKAMHELYSVKEPKLYSMGLYLGADDPARYVAAFNDQTEEARNLAKFGFAILEGATSFMRKFPDASNELILSRSSRKNPLHRHCPRRGTPECPPASLRYRTSDGSCNNLQNLWWGSAMSTMQRFLPPVYGNGIQSIRRSRTGRALPSAREVSSLIHEDRDVPLAAITHMLMQWGQFVDHDLTATGQSRGFNGTVPQCCLNAGVGFQPAEFMHPECLPIAVNLQDDFFAPLGVRCLEFLRSGAAPREDCEFGPREQLTQVTSYLDASTVYSSNALQTDSLRIFRNGLLQYGRIQSRRPLLPRRESDLCKRGSLSTSCFRAGDGRLSEQPALTALHVVFLRLHNRIATELSALNSHWSDEKIFQETRRIVGAVVQHITYREFLPIVLGHGVMEIFDLEVLKKGYYKGYDPTVNPTVANGFSTAAYRFGHSLVQHSFVRFDSHHKPLFNNVSIHDEFSNPVNLETAGSVDRLLLGLIDQPAQRRDEFITEELTNHLFQTPRFPFGMDLASLNIQRGRDHGLPAYVQWREPCGLSRIDTFEDLARVMSLEAARKFRLLYASVEDIDLFSAGLAEHSVSGGLVGPTFACIIGQQFRNLRRGDRFWYENPEGESSFTPGQLQQIRRISLAQVLCRTMDSIETIQPFVFLLQDGLKNRRVACDDPSIGELDLELWAERPSRPRSESKELPVSKFERKVVRPTKPTVVRSTTGKTLPQRQQPFKASIHQQNRIVVKRPFGPPDNVTIVVQNNAVNSPVFVNDAIYGSNIRIQQQSTTTQRPFYGYIQQNPVHQSYPVYGSAGKPISTSVPQFSSSQGSRPYVPHAFDDPSNPNPLNYGYRSPNYDGKDVLFESFSSTSPRPTLYTYYTNSLSKTTTTQRPQKVDGYLVNYGASHEKEQSYDPGLISKPTLASSHHPPVGHRPNSQSYVEQSHANHKPLYNGAGSLQYEENTSRPDQGYYNWQRPQYQEKPGQSEDWSTTGHQKRPYARDPLDFYPARPDVRPQGQTGYTAWSSSYNQADGGKRPFNRPEEGTSWKGPSYQGEQRPTKRPILEEVSPWSTMPSYQKESTIRPSHPENFGTYHDAVTSRPSSVSTSSVHSYQKEQVSKPIVTQDHPSEAPSISSYGKPTEFSTENSLSSSISTKIPYRRPVTSYDDLEGELKAFEASTQGPASQDSTAGYSKPPVLTPAGGSNYKDKPDASISTSQLNRYDHKLPNVHLYGGSSGLGSPGYSRPTKVQSVTIVSESTETVGSPGNSGFRPQIKVSKETPRPLVHVHPSKSETSTSFRRPGQYYYEKNVLHRYPDNAQDQPTKQRLSSMEESEDARAKTVLAAASTREGEVEDRGSFEKVLRRDQEKNRNSDDEDYDLEGAFSEKVRSTVALAAQHRIDHWLNPREDTELPSALEMPRLESEQSTSAKELPRPMELVLLAS